MAASRSTSSSPRGRCWATPTTGCRCAGSTCAARARIRAAASPGFRATTRRARSCATRGAVVDTDPRRAGALTSARASRRSASRKSSPGARCSTRSPCWAPRCARTLASATRCCSERFPRAFSCPAPRRRRSDAGSIAGHARSALAAGSCVGALALALLASAQGPVTLFAGWIVAGAAMALTLYDPAFAVLHAISGTAIAVPSRRSRCSAASRALCSGRCRSCCRRLWLAQRVRRVRAMHVVVCLPLHLVAIPRVAPTAVDPATSPRVAAGAAPLEPAGATSPGSRWRCRARRSSPRRSRRTRSGC